MPRNYSSLYEIKPGRFVFEPTPEARDYGSKLTKRLLGVWTPSDHYYHLGASKGHVAALQIHKAQPFFAKLDLSNFFGSVTRTKVARSLRNAGFSGRDAFDIAYHSIVDFGGNKSLPYGFIQSMALATLVMECSALGAELRRLISVGVTVSVYVDDIILSCEDYVLLRRAYIDAEDAVRESNFRVGTRKCEDPGTEIHAFNCILSQDRIEITPERMQVFRDDYATGSEPKRAAIEKYIRAVNPDQVRDLV